MQTFSMDSGLKEGVNEVVIKMMIPVLREAGVDLTDPAQVREALIKAHYGDALIDNCAERAAAEVLKERAPRFAGGRRKAWREWQDEVLVLDMRDELLARGVDLADTAAVHAGLLAANFSERNIGRLGEQAIAEACKEAGHAH